MAKLYPPYLEGTLPAFCLDASGDGVLTIPFAHNKAVSIDDFGSISVKVKTVQNDLFIADFNTKDEDCGWENKAITELKFTVKNFAIGDKWTDIKVGQFYKIQLAYRDRNDVVGYFSTVGVTKCTSLPSVTIKGFEPPNVVNNNAPEFLGVFMQAKDGDITEKVYSSRFIITDIANNVIEDTGDVLHNIENNPNSYESVDSFEFNRDLNFGEIYKIRYIVTTTNGCEISSPAYLMTQQKSLAMELKGDLLVDLNYNEGFVDVSIKGYVDENGVEEKGNGTFLLSREDSVNPGVWEKLYKFALKYESPTKTIFRDFTIEHGKTYTYSLQQYNENKIYSGRKKSNSIYADFEDMFLFDGERQLKLRFNPQVSNFKTQLSESRSETIGSKYPFFFRNAKVGYKTFPISGLISMLSDDNEYFTSYNSILREDKEGERHDVEYDKFIRPTVQKDTDLISENIASERLFKLKVLDWVNNGKVKLFRSPNEGNYIVRLMDNSLTPENGLGRMLHNYSGTAYECADYTYRNLVDFEIIDDTSSADNEEQKAYVTTWREKRLEDFAKNNILSPSGLDFETGVNGGKASKNLLEADIQDVYTKNLKFTDFLPGTRIRLVFDFTGDFDSDDYEEITIGSTGAYFANDIRRVYGIYLLNDSQTWISYQDYLRYQDLKESRIKEALGEDNYAVYEDIRDFTKDLVNQLDNGIDKQTVMDSWVNKIIGTLYEANNYIDPNTGATSNWLDNDNTWQVLNNSPLAKSDVIGMLVYYLWNAQKDPSKRNVLNNFKEEIVKKLPEDVIAAYTKENPNWADNFTLTTQDEWKQAWEKEYAKDRETSLKEEFYQRYGEDISDERFNVLWEEDEYEEGITWKEKLEQEIQDHTWNKVFINNITEWWESPRLTARMSEFVDWNTFVSLQTVRLQLSELEKSYESAVKNIDAVKKKKKSFEKILEERVAQKEEITADVTALETRLTAVQESIEEKETAIEEATAADSSDLSVLESELKELQKNKSDLERDIKGLRNSIVNIEDILVNTQKSIDEYAEKIETYENIIEHYEEDKANYLQQIADNNAILAEPPYSEFSLEYKFIEPSDSLVLWNNWNNVKTYLQEATLKMAVPWTNIKPDGSTETSNAYRLPAVYSTARDAVNLVWDQLYRILMDKTPYDEIENAVNKVVSELKNIPYPTGEGVYYDNNGNPVYTDKYWWDKWSMATDSTYCGTLQSGGGTIIYQYDVPVRNNFDSIEAVQTDIGSYRQIVGPIKDIVKSAISPDNGVTENVREEMTKICMSNYHKRPVGYLYSKEEWDNPIYDNIFENRNVDQQYRTVREDLKLYWDNNFDESRVFNDEESMKQSPFALYVIASPVIGNQNYYDHIHTSAYSNFTVSNNKIWLKLHQQANSLDTIIRYGEIRDAEAVAILNYGIRTHLDWEQQDDKYKINHPWKDFSLSYGTQIGTDEEKLIYKNSKQLWDSNNKNIRTRTWAVMHLNDETLAKKIEDFWTNNIRRRADSNKTEFSILFPSGVVDLSNINNNQLKWVVNNLSDLMYELENHPDKGISSYFAVSDEQVHDELFPNVDVTEEVGAHVASHLFEKYFIDAIINQRNAEELITRLSGLYTSIQNSKDKWYSEYIKENSTITYDEYLEALNNLNKIWLEQPKIYVLDAWSGKIHAIGDDYLYEPIIRFDGSRIDLREIENYSLDDLDASITTIDVGNGVYGEIFFRQATKTYELEKIEKEVVTLKENWSTQKGLLDNVHYYYPFAKDKNNIYKYTSNPDQYNKDISTDQGIVDDYSIKYLNALDAEKEAYILYLTALKKAIDEWVTQKSEEVSNALNQ